MPEGIATQKVALYSAVVNWITFNLERRIQRLINFLVIVGCCDITRIGLVQFRSTFMLTWVIAYRAFVRKLKLIYFLLELSEPFLLGWFSCLAIILILVRVDFSFARVRWLSSVEVSSMSLNLTRSSFFVKPFIVLRVLYLGWEYWLLSLYLWIIVYWHDRGLLFLLFEVGQEATERGSWRLRLLSFGLVVFYEQFFPGLLC